MFFYVWVQDFVGWLRPVGELIAFFLHGDVFVGRVGFAFYVFSFTLWDAGDYAQA